MRNMLYVFSHQPLQPRNALTFNIQEKIREGRLDLQLFCYTVRL